MDSKKLKEITTQIIGNLGNQALVSSLLVELEEDNQKLESSVATLTTTTNELTENNKALLKVNNDLFLKVGSQKLEQEKEQNQEQEQEQEQEKLEYASLFNEKGGLK